MTDSHCRSSSQQTVDLLIAYRQLSLRAQPFDEALSQWGTINLEQGAILHRQYVTFDPLLEGDFGAYVHLAVASCFKPDPAAQRCMVVPFHSENGGGLEVASAFETVRCQLDCPAGSYALYYEVCEGDEVYYRLTLVASKAEVAAHYLLDDPWGGTQGAALQLGML